MRSTVTFLILSVLTGASIVRADDEPKSVKTFKVRRASPDATTLYAIDADGTVRIDWDAVQALSASKADRTPSPVADVMLAIRDGRWKPLR